MCNSAQFRWPPFGKISDRQGKMNISKADAIAHLAKWYDAGIHVRSVYRSITGHLLAIGKIKELSSVSIKIESTNCEMLLYLRDTSHYDYKDARQPATEANEGRPDKYPIFINIKFSNGDHVEISESFGGAVDSANRE
jgi:hypothetical protein